jgi:hypothetical protein
MKTTPENSSKIQMVPGTGCDRCGLSALRSALPPLGTLALMPWGGAHWAYVVTLGPGGVSTPPAALAAQTKLRKWTCLTKQSLRCPGDSSRVGRLTNVWCSGLSVTVTARPELLPEQNEPKSHFTTQVLHDDSRQRFSVQVSAGSGFNCPGHCKRR